MNFDLTDERQMLQDSLRRFLADRYTTAARNAILDSETGLSAEIWSALADLGVIGALFTEEQGGFGGAGFDIAVVFEELGRAGVVEPFLDTALLGGGLIAALGNEDQQALVDEVIAGTLHLAFAHGEPASRYDLTARRDHGPGRGGRDRSDGRKSVVVNAEAAGQLIVSARESGGVDELDGISLFLVPAGTRGLALRGYPLLAGRARGRGHAGRVRVPVSARLGAAGQAFACHRGRASPPPTWRWPPRRWARWRPLPG